MLKQYWQKSGLRSKVRLKIRNEFWNGIKTVLTTWVHDRNQNGIGNVSLKSNKLYPLRYSLLLWHSSCISHCNSPKRNKASVECSRLVLVTSWEIVKTLGGLHMKIVRLSLRLFCRPYIPKREINRENDFRLVYQPRNPLLHGNSLVTIHV